MINYDTTVAFPTLIIPSLSGIESVERTGVD